MIGPCQIGWWLGIGSKEAPGRRRSNEDPGQTPWQVKREEDMVKGGLWLNKMLIIKHDTLLAHP